MKRDLQHSTGQIELKPDYADAWNIKGSILVNLGLHEEAVAAYNRAIELKPDLALAYYNKSEMLEMMGRLPEALSCINRAISLEPLIQKYKNLQQKILDDLEKTKQPPPPLTVATESLSHSPLPEIPLTILRAFEFYGGNIRVKISVKNPSQSAALDVGTRLASR